MGRIGSFHLVRERPGRAPVALARLGTDRPRLARVEGLRFWRLLGTGRGDDTGPSIDPRRTAMFAVWDHEAALESFLATSAIAGRWADADEAWHVRLRGLTGHGTWRGVDVLDGLERGSAVGPIAVVTRAAVRVSAWPAFTRASRVVADELRRSEGLLAAVGIGEAPVGRLGTFSLWRDRAALEAFARAAPHHAEAVTDTRSHGWFGEELFVRFEPYASSGRWAGGDPLA